MHTDESPPAREPTSGDRWAAAGRAAEALARGPKPVHGPSIQVALVVATTLMTGVGVLQEVLGGPHWRAVVAVVGWVVAVGSWVHARRQGRLEPFLPERSPASFLVPTERRELRRQLRGREAPTARSVELVDAVVRWQRRTSAASLPSLVGLGLVLLGNPRPLVPVVVLATGVLLVVLVAGEHRRWNRVQRLVAAVRSEQRG